MDCGEIDEIRIEPEEVAEIFLSLTRLNSPALREREVACWLKAQLRQLGLEVTEDKAGEVVGGESGNLVARLPGEGRGLILSAHMDTVEPTPEDPALREGDLVRSRGQSILGADDKGGIAVILAVLDYLVRNKVPHGEIEVVFTIGEELGLLGAKNLDFSLLHGRAAVVVDSEGPVGDFIIQAPSQVEFAAKFLGRAAHAGVEPEKGLNAIAVAAEAISALAWGRLDEETTSNVGLIQGGRAVNIVPAETLLRGEVRSHDPAKLKQQVARIDEAFHRVASKRGANLDLAWETSFTAFRLEEEHPLVEAMKKAIAAEGLRPHPRRGGGGSDANVFNQRGIPAVNMAMGAEDEHTPAEHIAISQLVKAARVLVRLVRIWKDQ